MAIVLPEALAMFGINPAIVMLIVRIVAIQLLVINLALAYAGIAFWLGWRSEDRRRLGR